jgi:hypothetical protein
MRNAKRIAALVLACAFLANQPAHAAPSCKLCADQQKACMKNYAGPACSTEYKICMKGCKK